MSLAQLLLVQIACQCYIAVPEFFKGPWTLRGCKSRRKSQAIGRSPCSGERRLNRAFDRCVGLSPKGFARVMRFREVYQQVQRGAALPWTRMAGDAGYADQPHLIREFQALAGLTPAQYAAERGVRFVQYGEKREG